MLEKRINHSQRLNQKFFPKNLNKNEKRENDHECQIEGSKKWHDEIVINFIGNMSENVSNLIQGINCSHQDSSKFEKILLIYSLKIEKLRDQRNYYKAMLTSQQLQFQEQKVQLSQEINKLKWLESQHKKVGMSSKEKLQPPQLQESILKTEKYSEYQEGSHVSHSQEFIKHDCSNDQSNSFEEQLITSFENPLLEYNNERQNRTERKSRTSENALNLIKDEELMNVMQKYNLSIRDLEAIFEQYERQHKEADQLFDSERQKELYKLGRKMDKELWNKKIIKDVKRISDAKQLSKML